MIEYILVVRSPITGHQSPYSKSTVLYFICNEMENCDFKLSIHIDFVTKNILLGHEKANRFLIGNRTIGLYKLLKDIQTRVNTMS